MAGIKNTYYGVIVVFGLISVNMRSVWFNLNARFLFKFI